MEEALFKKKLIAIKDVVDLRNEKYFNWLKNIITISVGLIGILISLKTVKSEKLIEHIFFIITISTIALGILSGVILLYNEVHYLNKIRRKKLESLQKLLDGNRVNEVSWIKRGLFYDIMEVVCFSSYIISLLSLVVYAILSDF